MSVAKKGTKLIIGNDCMLSSGIRMSTTDSHSIIDLSSRKRTNKAGNIIVGSHVWIGYNVAINKSCSIGDHSVIAAHSVVTKDVPQNSIAAGIPAKVVKSNIDWDRKRILE